MLHQKSNFDSGQAGFFCDSIYPKGETGEFGDKETFYGVACDATLETEHSAGIIFNKGFLSSSGFGDGGYNLYLHKTNDTGEVIGAKIVFIGDEDEEEDYED